MAADLRVIHISWIPAEDVLQSDIRGSLNIKSIGPVMIGAPDIHQLVGLDQDQVTALEHSQSLARGVLSGLGVIDPMTGQEVR